MRRSRTVRDDNRTIFSRVRLRARARLVPPSLASRSRRVLTRARRTPRRAMSTARRRASARPSTHPQSGAPSEILDDDAQEAVVVAVERDAARASALWRSAFGLAALVAGGYFAVLAARALGSRRVAIWRGVRRRVAVAVVAVVAPSRLASPNPPPPPPPPPPLLRSPCTRSSTAPSRRRSSPPWTARPRSSAFSPASRARGRSIDRRHVLLTLVPIRPRWRGERRSLRTLPGASLRTSLAFKPRPRCLSTPSDAFQLHPEKSDGKNDNDGVGPGTRPSSSATTERRRALAFSFALALAMCAGLAWVFAIERVGIAAAAKRAAAFGKRGAAAADADAKARPPHTGSHTTASAW